MSAVLSMVGYVFVAAGILTIGLLSATMNVHNYDTPWRDVTALTALGVGLFGAVLRLVGGVIEIRQRRTR